MECLNINDLVMCKDSNGIISAAGFKIDHQMLKGVEPFVMDLNGVTGDNNINDEVSKAFQELAVPAGLLCTQIASDQQINSGNNNNNNKLQDIVPISLFDKLLMMAETNVEDKKQTKKKISKKTKKNKNKTRKI